MIISQIWSVLHEFRLVRWLCASFNSPRLYSIVTGRTQKQTPWHSSEHSSAKRKTLCVWGFQEPFGFNNSMGPRCEKKGGSGCQFVHAFCHVFIREIKTNNEFTPENRLNCNPFF